MMRDKVNNIVATIMPSKKSCLNDVKIDLQKFKKKNFNNTIFFCLFRHTKIMQYFSTKTVCIYFELFWR